MKSTVKKYKSNSTLEVIQVLDSNTQEVKEFLSKSFNYFGTDDLQAVSFVNLKNSVSNSVNANLGDYIAKVNGRVGSISKDLDILTKGWMEDCEPSKQDVKNSYIVSTFSEFEPDEILCRFFLSLPTVYKKDPNLSICVSKDFRNRYGNWFSRNRYDTSITEQMLDDGTSPDDPLYYLGYPVLVEPNLANNQIAAII